MNQPRISIVVPNLNSGQTLERCLRSLLDQDYSNLELTVADGGSTDRSGEVLKVYAGRVAKVLRGRDGGQADAINRGFRESTGTIRGWLCADDELAAGALKGVADVFQRNPQAGVVAGACERVFEDGFRVVEQVRGDAWEAVVRRNTLDQPSVFWRAEWAGRAGELDTSFDLAFDWEYWCRLRRAGAVMAATSQVLSRYHFTNGNKTSTGGSRHVEEGYRIIREYGPSGLADAYRFIYERFDLKGCLDRRPAAPLRTRVGYAAVRRAFRAALGPAMNDYPWHFASLQARGMCWYRE